MYATPINVKQVLRENGAFDGVQFLHTPLSALAAALRPGAGAFRRLASGPRLKRGLTLAIEPMVNMRIKDIRMADDGWTALAVDSMPSAHFEHTIMVGNERAEILTIPEGAKSGQ